MSQIDRVFVHAKSSLHFGQCATIYPSQISKELKISPGPISTGYRCQKPYTQFSTLSRNQATQCAADLKQQRSLQPYVCRASITRRLAFDSITSSNRSWIYLVSQASGGLRDVPLRGGVLLRLRFFEDVTSFLRLEDPAPIMHFKIYKYI